MSLLKNDDGTVTVKPIVQGADPPGAHYPATSRRYVRAEQAPDAPSLLWDQISPEDVHESDRIIEESTAMSRPSTSEAWLGDGRRELEPGQGDDDSNFATTSQDRTTTTSKSEADKATHPREAAVLEEHDGNWDRAKTTQTLHQIPGLISRDNVETSRTDLPPGIDSLYSPERAGSSLETNALTSYDRAKSKAKTQAAMLGMMKEFINTNYAPTSDDDVTKVQAAMLKMMNDLNDAKNSFIKGVGQSVKAAAEAEGQASLAPMRSEGATKELVERFVAERVGLQNDDGSGPSFLGQGSALERPQDAPDQPRSNGGDLQSDRHLVSHGTDYEAEDINSNLDITLRLIDNLEGAGIRGYSSLLVLKKLMEAIAEAEQAVVEENNSVSGTQSLTEQGPESGQVVVKQIELPGDVDARHYASMHQYDQQSLDTHSSSVATASSYDDSSIRSTTATEVDHPETDTLPVQARRYFAPLPGSSMPLQFSQPPHEPRVWKWNDESPTFGEGDFDDYWPRWDLGTITPEERSNDVEEGTLRTGPRSIAERNLLEFIGDMDNSSGTSRNDLRLTTQEQPWTGISLRESPSPNNFVDQLVKQVLQDEDYYQSRSPESDHDSDRASVISQTESIWSVASLDSTATGVSAASGYSAAQIETATKELLSIFLENENLAPLYTAAIKRARIGPERLQRNIRRLLKAFAQDLQAEADKELERLAARLVSLKAAHVARSVIEKYGSRSLSVLAGNLRPLRDATQQDDASSDEEEEENLEEHVDEDLIEDLSAFRRFLADGKAFAQFQRHLEAFVLPCPVEVEDNLNLKEPTPDQKLNVDGEADLSTGFEDNFSTKRHHESPLRKVRKVLTNLLITVGVLEPPLEHGMVRVRWQCKCGEQFFGDVKEYRRDGVKELVAKMKRSTGATVTVTPYSATSTNQKWTLSSPAWVKSLGMGISSYRAKVPSRTGCLPHHNSPSQSTLSTTTTSMTDVTVPPDSTLHLLACAHRTQRRKCLLQDPIDAVSTDRELFCFMKQQLKQNYSRIRSFLSMRSVQGIFFIKFRLRMGNVVEVRDHDPCCTSTTPKTCECIPPAAKVEPSPDAEYRCTPAGPLATWPPVLSKDLVHMLLSPECVNEEETWVLEQLPKRTAGVLEGKKGPPVEGWGIYYEEGIDWDWVISIVFSIFLLASLLFGILWTKLEMDIQGAFGVSSYMVAASGITMAWLASRAKNFG